MKNSILLLVILFSAFYSFGQNVGIGTVTPSTDAILDITSTNKGLLLPRLNDTLNVANPTEGLLIYNKNTKSPNYHDGSKWRDIGSNLFNTLGKDSITYQVTTANSDFVTTPLGALSFSQFTTRSGTGVPAVNDLVFTKDFDENSIALKKVLFSTVTLTSIEFKAFLPNASTPYYSVKLNGAKISKYSFGAANANTIAEEYNVVATSIGFKDWINNKFFTYSLSTQAVTTSY